MLHMFQKGMTLKILTVLIKDNTFMGLNYMYGS